MSVDNLSTLLTQATANPRRALLFAKRQALMPLDATRFEYGTRWRVLQGQQILRDLAPDAVVLFVCHGNIVRSPMAERYARLRMADIGTETTVMSAGLIKQSGRPSPSAAVDAAHEFGVDLSDHRSQPLSADAIERSDVVFIMDVLNYHLLHERHPAAVEKTYFFRPVATGPSGPFSIEDPYPSTDIADYREAYRLVTQSVDAAVRLLAADRRA